MANFFPAASRIDVERAPSLNRRAQSRNTLREAGSDDSSSDGRQSRPSHINWLPSPSATTQQAGPPMPRRPPSVRLGRSASLSALAGSQPTLRRQSSLTSNHSLQLDRSAGSATSAHPTVAQLSPISERSYVPTPKREQIFTDVEPSTPVSIGSSYSAFLRRPLKRSISATSTSSLRTNATSTHPPILPPLNISPLELRPVYPPVSHRSGQQLVSTVYEDAGSERTGSFVTARSVALNGEEDSAVSPDAHGPSHTTIFSSPTAVQFGSRSDPLADFDRTTEGTTTLLGGGGGGGYSGDDSSNGNGSGAIGGSNSSSGGVPPARPRPRRRTPTSGAGGSPSDTFIWRRWTGDHTFGSRLSRASFSAARRAVLSHVPPLPILLFWAGFLAPWCWLIGGWLIEEGRWEDNGKARAALPLWKSRSAPKSRRGGGKAVIVGGGNGASGSQVPLDSFGEDLENGDAAVGAAREAQASAGGQGEAGAERVGREVGEAGAAGAPRWWYRAPARWVMPFACWRHGATAPKALGPSPHGEKVVTLVKPYSAEVWVYRCRLAAVASALMLLTALVVALVVVRGSNS